MIKKTMVLLLIFLLTFTYKVQAAERVSLTLTYDGRSHAYENEKITLMVNNTVLNNLPMQPIILDERTYVPAREVFETLGAVVDWKSETRQIYIGYGDTLIILEIDKPYININGTITQLSVVPKIINDKTMIPVRFAAEALDFLVDWNPVTRVVSIVEPAPQIPVIPTPTPTPSPDPNVDPEASAKDVSSGEIKTENHALTQITDIIIPSGASGNTYTIAANSAISRVDKILLYDNRLILDIYNAEMSLVNKTYDLNTSYLKSIRAAQNQVAPEMITRIVFDITAATSFSVSISGDRKNIIVNFEKNYINDFSFVSDGVIDQIIIDGMTAPAVSVFPLANPNRLVIDIPVSTLAVSREQIVNGRFSGKVRSAQFDVNTTRIVVDLKETASYSVTEIGNQTIVYIAPQTFQNISYDSGSRTIILAKPRYVPMDTSRIAQTDNYLSLKYSFTLPGDYTSDFGFGTFAVGDGYINSINIENVGGATNITVNEGRILAYTITEDAGNIYIRAMLPKEKYSKIVIIDPGHGGIKPGTNGYGMVEKDLTLDISLKLLRLLEADGTVKAYSIRLDDSHVENGDRAIFGNNLGDIYLSVHINSFNKIAEGTETLYFPHDNDHTIGISCQAMAELFQKNLLADLGTVDRKAKYQDVQVLRETFIPAVLTEISFVDSPNDAANLARDEYRQRAAASLMKSILQTFEIYTPKR